MSYVAVAKKPLISNLDVGQINALIDNDEWLRRQVRDNLFTLQNPKGEDVDRRSVPVGWTFEATGPCAPIVSQVLPASGTYCFGVQVTAAQTTTIAGTFKQYGNLIPVSPRQSIHGSIEIKKEYVTARVYLKLEYFDINRSPLTSGNTSTYIESLAGDDWSLLAGNFPISTTHLNEAVRFVRPVVVISLTNVLPVSRAFVDHVRISIS